MKKIKNLLALLFALIMILSIFAGCAKSPESTQTEPSATTETEPAATTEQETASEPESTVEAEPEAADSRYGGSMNVVVLSKPSNLDPAKSTGVWRYMWTNMVYEAPLTRDLDNNVAPGVCNFELSEDNLTLKLWVRDGITFHDGTAVEIEDVEASILRAGQMHKTSGKYITGLIDTMEITDGVLTIVFSSYDEHTLYYLASSNPWNAVLPQEICEKYAEEPITEIADAIGTGPYVFTDFREGEYVTVARYDGYVPAAEGYTGPAAPKMAYLDSVSFIVNQDYNSISMGILNGDYDVADGVNEDYISTAESMGILREEYPGTSPFLVYFNTFGNCATSSSADLRKAIMAAVDYDELVTMRCIEGINVTNNPVLGKAYAAAAFDNADYCGASDIELAQKYLDAAGYAGETVHLVAASDETVVATLMASYLDKAGINYEIQMMESGALSEYVEDPANEWDLFLTFGTAQETPGLLNDAIMSDNWNNAEKDALREELAALVPGTAAYIEVWEQLAQLWVDDCAVPVLACNNWIWYTSPGLHLNYEGTTITFYNSYWE